MAKELLVDTLNFRLQLSESGAGGKMIGRGVFAIADVKTANGRVYPRKIMERELAKLGQSITERKVFGELDHPADGKTKLARASHMITSLAINEQGEVLGEAEIMDTSVGKELKAILDAGGSVGISSRGYGSVVESEGSKVVQEDFVLQTFDFVADPAQGMAYPRFANESVEAKTDGKQEVKMEVVQVAVEPVKEEATQPKVVSEADHVKEIESLKLKHAEDMSRICGEATEKAKKEVFESAEYKSVSEALAKVKDILVSHILPEDMVKTVEAKDLQIKTLEEQLASAKSVIDTNSQELSRVTDVAKDLGYNLYLQRRLAAHPKFAEIVKGLGQLTKIESLEQLKQKVKLFEEELPALLQAKEADAQSKFEALQKETDAKLESLELKIDRLEEDKDLLKAKADSASSKLTVAAEERDEAIKIGTEAAARSYFERKATGHPHATEMRSKFEAMESKSKIGVDQLVESYAGEVRGKSGTDFSRIRNRLEGRSNNRKTLVEDSLAGTVPNTAKSFQVIDGLSMPMAEMRKLAGMSTKQ